MLKIDIEGGEFELLPSASEFLLKHKPTIYLSTHAPFLPQKDRKGKMIEVMSALSEYPYFYDHNLNRIDPEVLICAEFVDNVSEFVVSERKL